MKKIYLLFVSMLLLVLTIYLFLPEPKYPAPPPNAVQSVEDADSEDPLRRAYFTNYTREQVMDHYRNQFRYRPLTLGLNYPPEDGQTLIRDQTRSTYLEELVHPLRESLYINGFTARVAKDDIWYKGVHYQAKITVKYVPTSIYIRLPMAIASLVALLFVVWQYIAPVNKKNK